MHYGTGNYHPVTAKIYTDLSFFSCDPALGLDATRLFNYITGYAQPEAMSKLAFAPLTLRKTLLRLIEEEAEHARAGRPGAIWVKLNALVDPTIIDALYKRQPGGRAYRSGGARHLLPAAGRAGPLREHPGQEHRRPIPGAQPHRLLRRGYGLPGPRSKVFISSADWMPRNLNWRVETLVPIENPTVHQQVQDQIMVANLSDVGAELEALSA